MEIKKLTDTLSVGAQISPADVTTIAEAGFKTIICNRPDGEGGADQPTFASISEKADEAGIKAVYQPVISGAMSADDITNFATNMADAETPVFAYCRTGTRTTTLWTINEVSKGSDPKAILDSAASAGYDMSAILNN